MVGGFGSKFAARVLMVGDSHIVPVKARGERRWEAAEYHASCIYVYRTFLYI